MPRMSYPNSALSAWQLAIMAVVAVTTLAIWLTAVYLAAREPRNGDRAATTLPADTAEATGARVTPLGAAETEPPRQAA
jgi:hypothetical protein